MPVVDGVFTPRVPLTLAEKQVNFVALHEHIARERARLESAIAPVARRLALLVDTLGTPSPRVLSELTARIETTLGRTMRVGYRGAQAEIRSLRESRPVSADLKIPDAGTQPEAAADGTAGIVEVIRRRSHETTLRISEEIGQVARRPGLDTATRTVLLQQAAKRAAHNYALELVGETLNLGRTAGAFGMARPPEFALRSEQLDKQTCSPCSFLHGDIHQLGSLDYYSNLPPSGCLGGGRCRGVMVFGDGTEDFR